MLILLAVILYLVILVLLAVLQHKRREERRLRRNEEDYGEDNHDEPVSIPVRKPDSSPPPDADDASASPPGETKDDGHHEETEEEPEREEPETYDFTGENELEYFVSAKLRRFESSDGRVISNCYLRKDDGGTTEIDCILIVKSGLYVIECKNYSGWIFGSDSDRYWSQTLPRWDGDSISNQFYDPVWQNRNHIKCIRRHLPNYRNVPMRNIVVFGDESTLMDVTISSDARVVRDSVFLETIEEIESTAPEVISEGDIRRIYDILRNDVPVTDEVIRDHIAEVEHIREQKAYEKDYTGDTCPAAAHLSECSRAASEPITHAPDIPPAATRDVSSDAVSPPTRTKKRKSLSCHALYWNEPVFCHTLQQKTGSFCHTLQRFSGSFCHTLHYHTSLCMYFVAAPGNGIWFQFQKMQQSAADGICRLFFPFPYLFHSSPTLTVA